MGTSGAAVQPPDEPQPGLQASPWEEQGCKGLQLNRNRLKPETPSCLPVLSSALVWNKKAFAIGCCLPKMDQSLDQSYLADLALGDAHNAFLKLL